MKKRHSPWGWVLMVWGVFVAGGLAPSQAQVAGSAGKIERIPVATLELPIDRLIGVRVLGSDAVVATRDGRLVTVDVRNGRTRAGTLPGSGPVLDFALTTSGPVALRAGGVFSGRGVAKSWPVGADVLGFEVDHEETLWATGVASTLVAPRSATAPIHLPNVWAVMPWQHGFAWTLLHEASSGQWGLDLIDHFGNRMKQVYRFHRSLAPTGLTFGPLGPEGEALLSFWTGSKREIALIGQNGRMFWRLPAPQEQLCQRDLAWDHTGRLLVLVSRSGRLVLERWEIAEPQG
jgi:hypothetical protein